MLRWRGGATQAAARAAERRARDAIWCGAADRSDGAEAAENGAPPNCGPPARGGPPLITFVCACCRGRPGRYSTDPLRTPCGPPADPLRSQDASGIRRF
eukprot:4975503-Pyramimonas_sp.AAC.1